MPTVGDILKFVETLAPPELKMDWDNVGLLCGRSSREVTKVLVALDPFLDAAEEAADMGAELLLTHHPLIFVPCKAVNEDTSVGKTVLYLIEHGIAAVNAHTNLDCAPGGVNDVLADLLGLTHTEILTGTEGSGGRPYSGLLRAGTVEEQSLETFLQNVKAMLGTPVLRYADGGRPVRRVAVGGGACGSELMDAYNAGCDTFVTADVKYNQFWDARDLGMSLIDAGHFYTENPVCPVLAGKLRAAFPGVLVKVSENHRDCMKFW